MHDDLGENIHMRDGFTMDLSNGNAVGASFGEPYWTSLYEVIHRAVLSFVMRNWKNGNSADVREAVNNESLQSRRQ